MIVFSLQTFLRLNPLVAFRRNLSILVLAVSTLLLLPSVATAQTFTNAGTWSYTVPAGVSAIEVQVSGAGGGGGGSDSARGGNGGAGTKVTAVISVTPGQILSGTIGGGGRTGFTAGETAAGFGSPCTGGGAGGTGVGGGGSGANANCTAVGYSGGGGGGGGGTSFAINGVVFIQAGGGGGGGGGANGPIGTNGTSNTNLTTAITCGIFATGASSPSFNGDGGGGGGGGGGYSSGTAGISNNDGVSATGGGGGGNCRTTSTRFFSATTSADGGLGAAGQTQPSGAAGPSGSNGSVTISLSSINVQKISSIDADTVSAFNPKAVPGATISYCIVTSNVWSTSASNVVITDVLPARTSFVSNSLSAGTTCANATAPATNASISGTTVSANVGTLAPSASYALVYRVVLN